jgi:hypothetical protein
MEVRVKEVIINVDLQEENEFDKAFLESVAQLVKWFFSAPPQLKRVTYVLLGETQLTLAKLTLLTDFNKKGEDDGKGGGV